MSNVQRCPSIPKTRWLYAKDSLTWINAHLQEIQDLIAIYRDGEDDEVVHAHRNPILNLLAEKIWRSKFRAWMNVSSFFIH
jgi:hypothetical protein